MAAYDRGKAVETCRSKRWYECIAESDSAARDIFSYSGIKLYSYRCHICQLWHLSRKVHDPREGAFLEKMEAQFRANAAFEARRRRE